MTSDNPVKYGSYEQWEKDTRHHWTQYSPIEIEPGKVEE